MIQALAGVSTLLLIAVGWLLGLRLLALAHRTRQVPELTMGLGLLMIGGLGYPLAIAASRLAGAMPLTSFAALVGGATVCHLGLVSNCVFTWKVFRPGAGWARALVGASALAVVVAFAGYLSIGVERVQADAGAVMPWTLFLMVVATAAFGWSATEPLSYHAKLRRRLAIGPIEPVVVNRFLLWGVASAASTLGCVANGYFTLASPLRVLDPGALVVSGTSAAISALVMILTFLPPAGYLRFIESHHAARTA